MKKCSNRVIFLTFWIVFCKLMRIRTGSSLPYHFDANSDPAYQGDAVPDPTFQFDADPDP